MVCGLGEVGYRVAILLLDLGEEVTIVTLTARDEWLSVVQARGARVCIGDARNEEFLIRCGLETVASVIACTHNDGTNVEVMLDVRRNYPEKRTIARIIDPSMARHAEKHLGVHRAIAMTSAAAPIFAAATYGDSILTTLNVGEDRFLALRVAGPHHFAEQPLVVLGTDGECRFDQTQDLKAGELAVVMTHADTMADKAVKQQRGHTLLRALSPIDMGRFIRNVWTNTSVQLRAVLTVILGVFVVSVAVFQHWMNLSLVDSLYFVITTATTTGYGDITPKDASGPIKLYTCFMMIISATGLAILFSMVTDYVLSARMVQLRGHHHVPERGHVIVVGLGMAGYRAVEELIRLETPVVTIDRADDGEFVNSVRANLRSAVTRRH
jgi:Trk K+ transport system NAD-binding subunit